MIFSVAYGFASDTNAQFCTSTLIGVDFRATFLFRIHEFMNSLRSHSNRQSSFGPVLGSAVIDSTGKHIQSKPSAYPLPGDEPTHTLPNRTDNPTRDRRTMRPSVWPRYSYVPPDSNNRSAVLPSDIGSIDGNHPDSIDTEPRYTSYVIKISNNLPTSDV